MGDHISPFHPNYTFPRDLAQQSSPLLTHISLEPLPRLPSSATQSPLNVTKETCEDNEEARDQQNKPGKRGNGQGEILKLFKRLKTRRKSLPPKLENIRYRVLRTLKKALRRTYAKKNIKAKGLMGIDLSRDTLAQEWNQFQAFASEFRVVLEPFSQLRNGPKVDQARRPNSATTFTTYNSSYISTIFQGAEVRKVYQLFVKVLFAESNCESLRNRFGMRCCESGLHWSECEEKWRAFRGLMEGYLGANLAV